MNIVIIIIVSIIGILQIPDLIKASILRWIVLILCIFAATISLRIECNKSHDEKYDKNYGEIENAINSDIKYPMIAIGGAKFLISERDSVPYGLGAIFDSLKLDIWIKDNHLFINTFVTDENGVRIGEIYGNEWLINPCESFDRNFDDKGIEIKNNKGQIVLQADWDGEKVNLAGIFHKTGGLFPNIALYPLTSNGSSGGAMEVRKKGDSIIGVISPIFIYPSALHKGERIKK
jgi:hypothetical protein